MVLVGANIPSHKGDYSAPPLSKKERKEKAGETLIDTWWSASETEETAPCATQDKNSQKIPK